MAKHDLKAQTLQADFLDNLIQLFIQAKVPIRMASSDIDLSHPLSLITREILEEYTNGGIPLIAPWDDVETPINYYRTHSVAGKEYLFRSLVNDNVSEPTLESAGWEKDGEIAGLIPSWSSLTTYSTGQYVTRSQNVDGVLHDYAFKSKSNGNINHNPLDLDGVYWEFLGENRGRYVAGTLYENGDVVVDDTSGTNSVFISLSDNNISPTSSTGSTWQLIGSASEIPGLKQVTDVDPVTDYMRVSDSGSPENAVQFLPAEISFIYQGTTSGSILSTDENEITISPTNVSGVSKLKVNAVVSIAPATLPEHAIRKDQADTAYSKSFIDYTQADLQLEYEGSYYLSVAVPSGKVPIAIQRVQGGQTYYMPVNINSGILGGFSNNNSQTIRIYFI